MRVNTRLETIRVDPVGGPAVVTEPDTRGMLDTSTLILLGRLADPSALPTDSVISAITLAELSVGPHVARTAKERAARQAHLQQAEFRLRPDPVRA